MLPAESPADSTIGLACAGGVIEGAIYEIGALCALDEAIEGTNLHNLDVYVGVSSGALVGSMLASDVSAQELSRGVVSESQDESLNLKPEVLFRPAVREYAGRLQRLPGTLLSSLRYYLLNPGDLSLLGLLATFGAVIPTGLFTNAPLERFLAEAFATGGRTNDFRKLQRELYVVAMNLDSADVTVFGNPNHDHVPISSAPSRPPRPSPDYTRPSKLTASTTSTAWRAAPCTRASASAPGPTCSSASTRSFPSTSSSSSTPTGCSSAKRMARQEASPTGACRLFFRKPSGPLWTPASRPDSRSMPTPIRTPISF
ncbi:MAG: hypothetical protein BRD41_06940 [Bacteroidetes bacterium QS_1_63_11]|nr:MAG: hypothetical protein BRD41_06940 [Bacteroidetes bacterium QS_1_63_11]